MRARTCSDSASRRTNIVGTICTTVTPCSETIRRNSSASKPVMIVMSIPRIAAARAYTLGAVWYIGAGITVRSPVPELEDLAQQRLRRLALLVAGRRRAPRPSGAPVVPEV